MQSTSNRPSPGESTELISSNLTDFFSTKLQIRDEEEEKPEQTNNEEDEQEEEQEEQEFSFDCSDMSKSPISAEEAFQDGQIRPSFLFAAAGDDDNSRRLRPPLKKLFVVAGDEQLLQRPSSPSTPAGPCCEWTGKTAVEASSSCKKSNSTGFSRIRRFRDLVRRSNSDGKDAFVFLSSPPKKKIEKVRRESDVDKVVVKERTGGGKSKTTSSAAHEKHYVRSRAKREEQKRRSYLPYRQGVVGVGFFATVNGLSRNLHPF